MSRSVDPLKGSVSSSADRMTARHRWLRVGEWVIFALLAAQMCVSTLPSAWRTLNTDFPNYYLTARLVREHYDTSRIYEWIWLQRQKDHRDIDQRIVGMVPITPFSTLMVYPLTSLPALAAKHCWIILNLGLLVASVFLLRDLTRLSWSRIALVVVLSVPLRVNFLYGQYYVFLLFLLTLACWFYLRQRRFVSGLVVGLAAGLKVFPVLYLIYFLRKRDMRAFAGGVVGGLGAAVVSVFVFGWQLHRVYLFQVLPRVLRGEGLDPYNLKAASISSLLHRLFIYEPLLNLHPAVNAPWLFGVLHPVLQMALIAPALLLAVPKETGAGRIRLEWAAILLVSVATSTSASSYLLTLLILPACLVLASLQREKAYLSYAVLLPLYVAAGFLGGTNEGGAGWSALFAVPRLYVLVLFCVFVYVLMIRQQYESSRLDRRVWVVALSLIVAFGVASNLRQQRGLYADYSWRISAPKDIYMAVDPVVQRDAAQRDAIPFVAMLGDGYHWGVNRAGGVEFSGASREDYLAVTAADDERWMERTGIESTIVSSVEGREEVRQAESPVASLDGRWLAFLREDRGRGRIWVRTLDRPDKAATLVSPAELNVSEMSFLPDGGLIFAGSSGGRPGLFIADQAGSARSLVIEGRYPAVSPDGRWLAYSELEGGNWNLWLRDLDDGQVRRLTHAACNDVEPAWTADSQTLIYASDCGRALWFTALCRRPIPR